MKVRFVFIAEYDKWKIEVKTGFLSKWKEIMKDECGIYSPTKYFNTKKEAIDYAFYKGLLIETYDAGA